jgi:hypothetical protein
MINLYKKGKAMRNKKNKSEEELALEACTKMLITNFWTNSKKWTILLS